MLVRTPVRKGYSYLCIWMTSNWLEGNKTLIRCGKYLTKKSIWENQHLSLIMFSWDALKDNVKQAKILWTITEPCLSRKFPRDEQKSFHTLRSFEFLHGIMIWKVLRRNLWSDFVIPWSVNKLARLITKWTKACDKRLNRLISDIHHTCEYKQYCYVGNTAKQCRLGLFQDSDFAGDLGDSKSTSGGTLCVFGSHTFVPTSWMFKKQTSISHSSTESEIISFDAGLRLDGIPALDLWDLIVAVL